MHNWLIILLGRLNTVAEVKARLVSTQLGWCCIKHELEFAPKKLEIYGVKIVLPPHHKKKPELFMRRVYDVVKATIDKIGDHRLIHFKALPDGFGLAVTKKTKSSNLNIDCQKGRPQ